MMKKFYDDAEDIAAGAFDVRISNVGIDPDVFRARAFADLNGSQFPIWATIVHLGEGRFEVAVDSDNHDENPMIAQPYIPGGYDSTLAAAAGAMSASLLSRGVKAYNR